MESNIKTIKRYLLPSIAFLMRVSINYIYEGSIDLIFDIRIAILFNTLLAFVRLQVVAI